VNTLIPVRFPDSRIVDQHRRAAKVVAALSENLDDCIELLAMLGLDASQNTEIPANYPHSTNRPRP
jgi:hypothetical protein